MIGRRLDRGPAETRAPLPQGAFPGVMKDIMQNLANQYRLVYSLQAPDDGKLHQIKVDAFQVVNDRRHEFKVRVRKGWRF